MVWDLELVKVLDDSSFLLVGREVVVSSLGVRVTSFACQVEGKVQVGSTGRYVDPAYLSRSLLEVAVEP